MTTHFKYRIQRLLRRLAFVGAAGFGAVAPGWGEISVPWDAGAPAVPEEVQAADPGEIAEPRVPVLLVPGWGDEAATVEPLRNRFTAAGWPESRVSVLSFRDPVGSNEAHAAEIDRAVRILRGLTGAPQVDVVAHSMGGLATRHFLLVGEEAVRVRRVVFLATPHRGTVVATVSWGEGGREMVPGSAFLTRLNQAPPVPEGILALAIRTPFDTRVIPASSAILPDGVGVENLELCCPTHNGMVDDPRTFEEVAAFLRGEVPEGIPVPHGKGAGAPVDPSSAELPVGRP